MKDPTLLYELAWRHLLGGRLKQFIGWRWKRWLSGLFVFILSGVAALYVASQGNPVWGVGAFMGTLVALFIVHRLVHGELPEKARGAYATAVTMIAVVGIALAVMTLIVVVSVMDGFSRDIQEALLKTTPEVTVTDFDESLDPALAEAIRRVPGVAYADPYIENDLLLKIDGYQRPVPIRLHAATEEHFLRPGGPDLIEGNWSDISAPDAVVLGEELAKVYFLGVGDKVWILSPQGTITPMGVVPSLREMEVVGLFRTGFYEVDQGMVITGLDTARDLLEMGEMVSGLNIKGEGDPFEAVELAEKIRKSMSAPLVVLSWAEKRRNLYQAMKTEKAAMFIVELLLILIASFNISSTIFMAVSRKTREIGILRCLGWKPGDVLRLFALEGILIGGIGTLTGATAGCLFALYLKYFPIEMPGGGSVYYIHSVPVHVSPSLIAITIIASMTLSLLASIYPARRAAALAPAKALRFE